MVCPSTRIISVIVFEILHHSIYFIAANKITTPIPPKTWVSGCIKYASESSNFNSFPEPSNLQSDYQNECAQKVNDKYICNQGTQSLVFTCEADYPIVWRFQTLQRFRTEYRTVSNFSVETKQPVSQVYRGIVEMPCGWLNIPSAILICSSTELVPEIRSHFYTSTKSIYDWLSSQLLTFYIGSNQNTDNFIPLLLPCRKYGADETVKLEKQVEVTGTEVKWNSVNFTDDAIAYESTLGFMLNTTKISIANLVGVYRCAAINATEHPIYNVTWDHKNQTALKSISGNASVTQLVSSKSSERPELHLRCCSGVLGKPPKIEALSCYNKPDCKLMKLEGRRERHGDLLYDATDCSNIHMYAPLFLVSCKGENVDFRETYVGTFHKLANAPVKERKRKIVEEDRLNSVLYSDNPALLTRYTPQSNIDNLETKQKMLVVFARRTNNSMPFDKTNSLSFHMEFGFQLFYENLTEPTNQPFSDSNDNRIHSSLREYSRDVFYEGEPITIVCLGWQLYYAKGAKLAINWKNGTVSEMSMESFVDRQGFQYLYLDQAAFSFIDQGMRTYSVISKEIRATEDIQSVECWMPRESSSKWETLAKPVQVKTPGFEEAESENLSLSPSAEKRNVACTIAEWEPEQTISLTWNDKPLSIYWNTEETSVDAEVLENTEKIKVIGKKEGNEQIQVQIQFYARYSRESGTFRCIADNGFINVTRTVYVNVEDTSSNTPVSYLLVTIVLIFVIFIETYT